MSDIRVDGGWYCDARPDSSFAILIPGLRISTHRGPVALPPGGNLLYLRISPDGTKIAGAGHTDDRVWEWTGTEWKDRGHAYGVSPVIYDRFGTLRINDGSWGSQGARFFTADGRLVTADESYFASHMELSEWSQIATDLYVGQSHPDGTNDAAWVWDRGRWRLLEPGPCRFIRAHRSGDRVSIAIWKPGQGAVIHWLSIAEINALPMVTLPSKPAPQPPPKPEPPKPEPVPVNHLETVRAIRAKYPTPLGARHWEFLVEVAQAVSGKLFRKDGGDRVHVPALGFSVSQDIVILPASRQWVDILGDAENTATAAWAVHDNAGEPEKWIDVAHIRLPGRQPPAPDPVPSPPPPPTGPKSSLGELIDLELSNIHARIDRIERKTGLR